MENGKLPPLVFSKQEVVQLSWLDRKRSKLDELLLRAATDPVPWWKTLLYKFLRALARLTNHFGRVYPYFFRPWRWISKVVRNLVDRQQDKNPLETPKTLFLKRMFKFYPKTISYFSGIYAGLNWVAFLFLITLIPATVATLVEGIYAYSTYPFGYYENVVITARYRNISDYSTYAVHGYQVEDDGSKKELYFELGSNMWFWDLYPEFMFGQIAENGKCNFHTYGLTIRFPKAIRIFGAGNLYVLNPWIASASCTSPTIVPK